MAFTEEQKEEILRLKRIIDESPDLPPEKSEKRREADALYSQIVADREADREAASREQYAEPTMLNRAKHVLSGVAEGAFDTIETPYNLEQIGGMGAEMLGFNPETRERSTAQAGVDAIAGEGTYQGTREMLAGDVVDPDQNPITDALKTAASFAGPGGPFRLVKSALQKKRTGRVNPETAKNLGVDAIIGGAAGAGSYIAGQLPDQYGVEREYGEMAAGFPAAVIAPWRMARARAPVEQAVEQVEEAAGRRTQQLSEGVRRAAEDGEIGSIGDVSGLQGVTNLELGVARGDPRFAQRLAANQKAREAQIVDRIESEFSDVDPGLASTTARERVGKARERVDTGAEARAGRETAAGEEAASVARAEEMSLREQLEQAESALRAADESANVARAEVSAADQALAPPPGTFTDTVSREMSESMSAADRQFNQERVQPAWQAFKEGPEFDVPEVESYINNALKGISVQQREDLMRSYGGLLKRGETTWREDEFVAPEVLQDWLTKVREAAQKTDADGRITNDQRNLSSVVEAVEESMGVARPAFADAKAATRELYSRFREGPLKSARRKPPAEYAAGLRMQGDAGSTAAEALSGAGVAGTPQQLDQYMRAYANQGNPVDDTFVSNFRSILQTLPKNLSEPYYDAAARRITLGDAAEAAREAATETRATRQTVNPQIAASKADQNRVLKRSAAAAEKALSQGKRRSEGLSKTVVARFAENPRAELKSMLSNPDRHSDLSRLARYMSNAGGEVSDAFSSAMRQELDDMVLQSAKGEKSFKPEQVKQFRSIVNNMTEAGAVSPDVAGRLKVQMQRTMSLEQRRNAIADLAATDVSELTDLAASGLSAILVGGLTGTQTLLLGGAVRRNLKRLLAGKGYKPKHVALIEEMMLDPQTYLKRLEDVEEIRNFRFEEEVGDTGAQKLASLFFAPIDSLRPLAQTAGAATPDEEEAQ